MPLDDCPTCGSRRSLVTCEGIEKRRFPRGKFVCQNQSFRWHQELENLQRSFDLSTNLMVKNALQQEIENLILEHCIFEPQRALELS